VILKETGDGLRSWLAPAKERGEAMGKTKSVKAFVTTRRMTDINRYTSNERLCTLGMVLVLPTGKSDRGESISALCGSGTLYEVLST
jgi:hypothetical protein